MARTNRHGAKRAPMVRIDAASRSGLVTFGQATAADGGIYGAANILAEHWERDQPGRIPTVLLVQFIAADGRATTMVKLTLPDALRSKLETMTAKVCDFDPAGDCRQWLRARLEWDTLVDFAADAYEEINGGDMMEELDELLEVH